MRSRILRPGFFTNPELVELNFETRLLFAGLPLMADRRGRLRDRPKRIKMTLFPADDVNVDNMLNDLEDWGFVDRYEVDGTKYLQIINFEKHQYCHVREPESSIPAPNIHNTGSAPDQHQADPVPAPDEHDASTDPAHLSLSLSLSKNIGRTGFDRWWDVYDKKVKKKQAKAIWKRRKLDRIADEIIADTKARHELDKSWKAGYQPHPTTYLNGDRWEDVIEQANRPPPEKPTWQPSSELLDELYCLHGRSFVDGMLENYSEYIDSEADLRRRLHIMSLN